MSVEQLKLIKTLNLFEKLIAKNITTMKSFFFFFRRLVYFFYYKVPTS